MGKKAPAIRSRFSNLPYAIKRIYFFMGADIIETFHGFISKRLLFKSK